MKELSIEEKAQRYDNAIEIAKSLYDYNQPISASNVIINNIFPELKESMENEDERMQTLLFNIIEHHYSLDIIKKDEQLKLKAWVEKHGEQKLDGTFVNVDDVREDFVQEVYRVLDADSTNDRANQIIDAFDNLPTVTIEKQGERKHQYNSRPRYVREEELLGANKQGEQKPVELEEPNFFDDFRHSDCEQKEEWSEEDKAMLDFAIRAVGLCKQYAINHQVNGYSELPDVPKKYEKLQDWLKSLKDRYTWKPSEEYIQALDEVYKTHSANNVCRRIIFNLMNDLKKLKE